MSRAWRSATLSTHPAGPDVRRALDAALRAADPSRAVEAMLEGQGSDLAIAGRRCGPGRRIVIGVGKAAVTMTEPVVARLEVADGVVVSKTPGTVPGLSTMIAGHPLPDEASLSAGRRIAALLQGLHANDTVILLLSGGASTLVIDPPAAITLADLRATISALLRAGADIGEINAVRKHLDGLKGGQLAARADPARVIALALSDVPGDQLDTIASGPSVGDGTRFVDALDVLQRHGIEAPAAVLEHLHAGAAGHIAETPRHGDPRLAGATTTIVAGNATATQAAAQALREGGFAVDDAFVLLAGEARDAGRDLAEHILALPRDRPRAIVAGGETVVHVRGQGHGGRNQELALSAVEVLAGHPAALLCTLATDGEDGPTDAAGAVVDGHTLKRGTALGLDVRAHLDRNDAYAWFHALHDLLRIGPTGTNVCDLALAVYDPRVKP